MSGLTVLAVLAAAVGVPALYNLARHGDIRRIAVRNIVRRPVESALVVLGSALGTAIIVAALMVGDTFDHSIRDIARTNLGEIDLAVEFENPDQLDEAHQLLGQSELEGLDGLLAARDVRLAAAGAGSGDQRAVEPRIDVLAIDFSALPAFGSAPNKHGLVGLSQTPGEGQIAINADLADDLDVGLDDQVTLFAAGQELNFDVVSIVEPVGLGGYSDAFVSRELADQLDPAGVFSYDHLLLSATGQVYDSTAVATSVHEQVTEQLERSSMPATWDAREVKRDLLDEAEDEGAELTQIFSVVGGFSVLAGVLLLINLFVMLAEERKPNLGVLRAIGWRRSSLRRAFRAEGVLYAATASLIGALAGTGVGWIIVQLTKNILAGANPNSDFQLQVAVEPASLVTAALIGFTIAMAAIWFTSWRISRLNIIAAIRDLPEPKTRRSLVITALAGLAAVAIGGLLLVTGLDGSDPFTTIVSVPLALAGIGLLCKSVVNPQLLAAAIGLAITLWGGLFFPVMPTEMTADVDVTFFLLFGVIIVAGGVAVTTVVGPWVQRLLTSGKRPMVEARVAMAYPAARLFRTASSLAMYSLIIFTLAFMAVLSHSFSLQTNSIAASTAAGHDIIVQANASNPISPDALGELDGVTTASPLLRTRVDVRPSWQSDTDEADENLPLVGVEPSFVEQGAPSLLQRAERFATDEDALAAVAADPTLVIVPDWFDEVSQGRSLIGETITTTSTETELVLEVVGVTNNDFAWSGLWMATETAQTIDPQIQASRVYVAVAPEHDAETVASVIEARFLANGADAETFSGRIDRFIEADQGFFSLLRGYLLLGLVIGIAGLTVSLFRAVRERRRQIGMMRAMGLPAQGIGRWFITEAAFISLMGIGTGVGLGLLTGYLTTTQSTAFDDASLPFAVPWAALGLITLVPLIASIVAALVPARNAARLRPSEALRLAA